jgi:hypothetical protein
VSDTQVILVSPEEFEVLRRALLNLRTSNFDYVRSEQKKTAAKLPEQLARIAEAERRLTTIDELLDRLVPTTLGPKKGKR